MASNQIVPFGKYKGQPVETMAADRAYCEWLMAQDWFPARYSTIHTLIINHFGQPAETPEHNALQALFLDEKFAKAFIVAACGGPAEIGRRFEQDAGERIAVMRRDLHRLETETYFVLAFRSRYGRNAGPTSYPTREDSAIEAKWLAGEIERVSNLRWRNALSIEALEFESDGNDVMIATNNWASASNHFNRENWLVECKPSFGDDYPAILRNMGRTNGNAVLLGDGGYAGAGATFDQVKRIFAKSGIVIVRKQEVNLRSIEP